MSDDSLDTGESFTLSTTVSNTGDGESAATTLRYYRSTDTTITTSDTQVGTDGVGALAASGSSAESIELNTPSTPGDYFYGACVDPVVGETGTNNNCSDSVPVVVKERQITSSGFDMDLVYVDPQRSSTKTPVIGRIRFDSSDVSRLSATTVGHIAEHELAHVLGFGLRWSNLQNPSFQGGEAVDPPPDTHWPGTKAIAAFNAAGGSSYQGGKVPVENERGGSGSQDRHWRLSAMPGELMTYNLDGAALSAITIQSMADLGYSVNTSVADSYTVPSTSQTLLTLAVPRDDQRLFHCEIELPELDYVPELVSPSSP